MNDKAIKKEEHSTDNKVILKQIDDLLQPLKCIKIDENLAQEVWDNICYEKFVKKAKKMQDFDQNIRDLKEL